MPYNKVGELPDSTKGLPAHGKEIYMKAFNGAWEQYKDRGDQREALSHATAWSAVEKVYKKNAEGKWVARESKMKEADLSNENKRNMLQLALITKYDIKPDKTIPKNLAVEEVFEDKIIYDVDGQLYESSYELDKDGNPIFGEPKKVTSTKIYTTKESLSMENRRVMLEQALVDHLNLARDEYIYIEDMTETEVFYNRDRQSFKVSYTIGEDDVITVGDPVKVTRQVTFKPIESLQAKYSEIVQEVGRRNAATDSARVKKIMELCQELLSSEDTTESKVIKAIKEADSVLELIKEQAVMKTEDGVKFPAEAYAYVPDKEKSTTWKLRIWEDPDKKVTRAQLGRAAAALSPGGFRGQKVAIPSADLPAVKRKLRTEYRKLDVEPEEMPRWVRENESREELIGFVPLTEATFDKGKAHIIVIKAGFNADQSRFYPAEVLKRDYGIFEGLKMYADHPTETEERERPERSIHEWVATLKDVECDEAGTVTGVADIIESWLMTKLASLRDKEMLSEMGISINAVGTASKSTIDGVATLIIEKLERANSVDFVTEPGAGGEVTLYEADRSRNVDLVELATLKERRPDLVKAITSEAKSEITREVKKAMENEERIKELEGQIIDLTSERDGLKTKMEEAEKEKSKAEASALIKEAVDKAELPEAAKERILERFKDAESADGIDDAIQAEKDYIAKLAEAGTVKNLGPTKRDPAKEQEALKESWRKLHPEWTDAQIETAISGT